MEHAPTESEQALTPEQERIDYLTAELIKTRGHVAESLRNFDSYRRMVRATVIENIRDGTICRAGANEALESWGEPPYEPRYNVRMTIDLEMVVDGDDEDAARDEARNALTIDTGEYEFFLHDAAVTGIEELPD